MDKKTVDLQTLQDFAASRGGVCRADGSADPHDPVEWTCARGHRFSALPQLLMEGGYWCPECFPTIETSSQWDWDEIAKQDPLLRSVHVKD